MGEDDREAIRRGQVPNRKTLNMPQSLTLAEAKGFLRVGDATEDATITLLIDAAEARVAAATGLTLSPTSAAPLRLSVLTLVSHAYANRDTAEPSLSLVEPWLAPYRKARL
jgi:hypothetical protein